MIIPKAFSFLTISCLFLISCSFLERFDSHFDDYSKVIESQSWKGGWLPRNLPKDAFDIYESHDLDTNERIVWFKVINDFKAVLDSSCQSVTIEKIEFLRINAEWWPQPLYDKAVFPSHEFYYYICESGYFAIPSRDKNYVYFWSPRS